MAKNKTTEDQLLKALNELEEMVHKGDPLEEADPEGGFATQGTPLSDKVPKGKMKVKKGEDDESMDDESGGDDAGMMEKGKKKMPMPMKKKMKKAMPEKQADADASSSSGDDDVSGDEDMSSDDDSSGAEPMGKSLSDRMNENEAIRKSVEVSEFIQGVVDQTCDAYAALEKSLRKREDRLSKSIDERFDSIHSENREFQVRLAKAVVMLGKDMQQLHKSFSNFGNQPSVPQRRSVLSKSEINEREFHGGETEGQQFSSIPRGKIADWMVSKGQAGEMTVLEIASFEQNNGNPMVLRPEIRKALINDLSK